MEESIEKGKIEIILGILTGCEKKIKTVQERAFMVEQSMGY